MATNNYPLYEHAEPKIEGLERELYDEVSEDEMWGLLEELSQLKREPGSRGLDEAADRITSRFESYGVPYDRYDPEFWIAEPTSATVRTLSPVEEEFAMSDDPPQVKGRSFCGDGTVRGSIVEVDVLPEATEMILWDHSLSEICSFEGELTDNIVLLKPPDGMPLSLFGHLLISTVPEFEARGATAVLLMHPLEDEPRSGSPPIPFWGGIPRRDQVDIVPDVPVLNISKSVGERLIELADRGTLDVEVATSVPHEWATCPVVIGRILGGENPGDDFVLLHGHLDSFDVGVTDNATGNVAMVECARLLNENRDSLRRDILVGFWPMHETGKYAGSTWFVDEFAHDLADNCIAHVNIDGVGVKGATEFEKVVWMPEASDLCRDAIFDVAGKESVGSRPPRAGDHSFFNLGISSMLMTSSSIPTEIRDERGYLPGSGCGGNSDIHHLTTNTLDHADPEVLVRDTRVYLVILSRLLTDEVIPLDHRRTIERHAEIIDDYTEQAPGDFDLEPVREELTSLGREIDTLYDEIDESHIEPAAANRVITRISRTLVRVNFASEGKFDQDLAIQIPPYPRLQPVTGLSELSGDAYRFERIHLKRARNAVVDELRRAKRAVSGETGQG